jgi:hypothetical protein
MHGIVVRVTHAAKLQLYFQLQLTELQSKHSQELKQV